MDASSLNPVQLDVVWREEYRKAALRVDRRQPPADSPPWVVARETSEIVPLGMDRSSPQMQLRAATEKARFDEPRIDVRENTTLSWPPRNAFDTDANGSAMWPPAQFETAEPSRRAPAFVVWSTHAQNTSASRP